MIHFSVLFSTRIRRLEQALEELRALQPKLNRYKLKQRQQIQQRIQEILKNRHCQTLITYEIHTTREYQHLQPQKVRPTPGATTQVTWKPIFSLSFGINQDALREAEKTDGVFPLITSLPIYPENRPCTLQDTHDVRHRPFLYRHRTI
ncbi:MAG: hypothetical protein C4527_28045 [Candidatus Omnitrophota bacterium]|nr:MAG: hypothetical protein C4527_28045 [Candidatus Omnitrophota bacterium]